MVTNRKYARILRGKIMRTDQSLMLEESFISLFVIRLFLFLFWIIVICSQNIEFFLRYLSESQVLDIVELFRQLSFNTIG